MFWVITKITLDGDHDFSEFKMYTKFWWSDKWGLFKLVKLKYEDWCW